MACLYIYRIIISKIHRNVILIRISVRICLFDIICGVRGKTTEGSECCDKGFLPKQKSHITYVT